MTLHESGEVHAPPTDAAMASEPRTRPLSRATSVELDALLDGLPGTIVYRMAARPDGTRRLLYVSASIEALTGLGREAVLADVTLWYALIGPDQVDRVAAAEAAATASMSRFREEVRYLIDGHARTFEISARPTRMDDGTVLWDGTATDVSELVAQRAERERLAAILRETDDLVGMARAKDGKAIFLNEAYRAFAGLGAHDDPGSVSIGSIHADTRVADYRDAVLPTAAREGRWSGESVVRSADGRERVVSQIVIAHPARDAGDVGPDGAPPPVEHYSTIMRDITDRAAMERRLREASERAEIALREVNHRVKNLFALVPALVQLSARGATDVTTLVGSIRDRVAALGRAHALTLNAFSEDHGVALDALIRAVLEPYEDRAEAFSMAGPSVRLSSRNGNAMSLALHEMATNAAKYGALAAHEGRVAISWSIERGTDETTDGTTDGKPDGADGAPTSRSSSHVESPDRLVFSWREAEGPKVTEPLETKGFGTTLIDRLIRAQEGTIEREWHPDGLAIEVTLPVHLKAKPRAAPVEDAIAPPGMVATEHSIVQEGAR